MRDSAHNHTYLPAIPPTTVTDNTAIVSNWVDRSGFESLTFAIIAGTLADADATFTLLMEEADAADQSDAAAVADQDMISASASSAPEAAASFSFADDNKVKKVGYIGFKKWVRVTVTPSGNTGSAPFAAIADLSRAASRPAP